MTMITHGQIAKKQALESTDFFWNMRRFGAFDVVLMLTKDGVLDIRFGADVVHRRTIDRVSDVSLCAMLRGPQPDQVFESDPFVIGPAKIIPGCCSGRNILPRCMVANVYGVHIGEDEQKYENITFSTLHEIKYEGAGLPQYYRVESWGKARSDANPGGDGNVELLHEATTLNHLTLELR